MKNILKLLTVSLLLLTACDSTENNMVVNGEGFLPQKIVTQQSYDAEPWYDYTHITSFEYDNTNRPVTIVKETFRKSNTEADDNDVLTYSITQTLEYSLTEDIVKRTDVIKSPVSDGYDTRTETRVYNITSGENIIEVTLNDTEKERIELSDGLVTKYDRKFLYFSNENGIGGYTEKFKYNDKGDISEYTHISLNDDYTSTQKYSYDNYNGIYKNINIPQWLFIALFGNEGRINNITDINILSNNTYIPYGKNVYKYNSDGYVEEANFTPDSNWIGLWGSKTTYQYVKTKEVLPID
jgi:hypothetical protein